MSADNSGIDHILADLNDRQRAAATHGDSPLLIVAGAGTGKTTTLAHRVAYLISTGVDPKRILLLTFTRRAAAELLRRVDGILQEMHANDRSKRSRRSAASRAVWGGTFHAVAARLLRRHGQLIGLPPEFTIFDRSDAEDLFNVLRAELELAETGSRFPLKGTCLDIYSRLMNTRQRLDAVLNHSFPWCAEHHDDLKTLFNTYIDRKESLGVLDYDDLLFFWHAMVHDEQAGNAIRKKFDCVLVDEYQDTNLLQAEILTGLAPDGQRVTVVGDDAQSIYSFRAATVRNILDFPKKYPDTTVVALEQNYRSSQPILNATNRVIAQATERHRKELWSERTDGSPPVLVHCQDEDEQTDFLVDQILEHRENGLELKQQAVLFRASHHSIALEVELSRQNIPFHKYGGLKFIETAHVKDLMAFLKLGENPRDIIAALRVLMLLPGIGRKKAGQLIDQLEAAGFDFNCWRDYRPPTAAKTHWPLFVALMRRLAGTRGRADQVESDLADVRIFYTPLLELKYDHAKVRLRDLKQLEQVASRFADRQTFLTEITLDPPSSTQDLPADPHLDEDYLILSTIHSAKGLEWDAVYVIHAADGNIPSDMSTGSKEEIEEELRLFYVALTRAKTWLYVCHPERYYFHGRFKSDAHSFSQLTRFLPEDILPLFERRSAGLGEADDDETSDVPSPHLSTAGVRNRIRRAW
jgi:DNA helicase-2/ATP-dependent DNA helicase PcrA